MQQRDEEAKTKRSAPVMMETSCTGRQPRCISERHTRSKVLETLQQAECKSTEMHLLRETKTGISSQVPEDSAFR